MYQLITYGFPVILIGFEWGIRALLGVDTFAFIGPTLAAAGLCFLAPLTRPKEIMRGGFYDRPGRFITITRRDNQFIGFTWILILVVLFAWGASCVFSNTKPALDAFSINGLGVKLHFFIGLLCYLTSVLMTFLKEVV